MKLYPREGFVPPAKYQFIFWTDAGVEVYDVGEVLPPHIAALKNPPVDPNAPPPKSLEQEIAELKAKIAAQDAEIAKLKESAAPK